MNTFKTGDKVRYIPPHANGYFFHKDCEEGVVSSVDDHYVFVYYMRNGILQQTAAATNPKNLVHI